jgi:uncharacterized coiled-coil DUF342 family protein
MRRGIPPFEIPVRVATDLENQLRDEFNSQFGALRESWEEFHARRLAEFGLTPEELDAAMRGGEEEEKAKNKGKKKEIEKFEAAARASAEAVSRIYNYMERVVENRSGDRQDRREMVARMAPEAQARIDEHNRNVVGVLREIRDGIRLQNDEPQIIIEPVGLA